MKSKTLMLLRVSVGLLILVWGIDKVVNVDHGLAISERFYLGMFSSTLLLQLWGVFQSAIGVLTIVGLFRRFSYSVNAVINAATLIVVWRSVVDPWGWYLEGTNALFFPSSTVFAASLVMLAFMDEDTLSFDVKFRRDRSVDLHAGRSAISV